MKRKIKFLVTAIALFASVFIMSDARAATGGIQISPLTFKYEIEGGKSKDGEILIKNLNAENLDYIIEMENFTLVSDDGAPSFAGKTEVSAQSSLAEWIKVSTDQTGTILPGAEKRISFTVTTPIDAEPGGHYAAIFAKQIKKSVDGQTQIGIASRVGALVLVTVPGEVEKGAEITEFLPPKVIWKGPVDFSLRVKNTGNIHFDSKAVVEIKPIFGRKTNLDLGTHTILPDNIRNFAGIWGNKYPIGRYQLTATATDADGKQITKSEVLWAVPLIIVIPVLFGLIFLLLIVKYLKKHLKFIPEVKDDKDKK